jgi:hypothetical protein
MMKIFKFFYKCAIYADPRFGIFFHLRLMICGFILNPIIILSIFFLNRDIVLCVLGIPFTVFAMFDILWLPVSEKRQKKITNYLLGVPPVLPKDKRSIMIHQLYFYIIGFTMWLMPLFLFLFLDIVCDYWR